MQGLSNSTHQDESQNFATKPFLNEIRERAEKETGIIFRDVVSGRPVRFHSKSKEQNEQALKDLTEAYQLAGFNTVDFLPEPEAAAIAVGGSGLVLIVDIGGGTSDFTVCEGQSGHTRILASEGIRLVGTNFDKDLSIAHVMPSWDMVQRSEMKLGRVVILPPGRCFMIWPHGKKLPLYIIYR